MKPLPVPIKLKYFEFLHGDVPLEELEQWIYSTNELEEIFSRDDYLELISLNYRTKDSKYELQKIFKRYVDEGEWEAWKLKKLLNAVIDRKGDFPQIFRSFYDLYCDGYSFLDNLGLGYGLSVVVPPSTYSSDTWEKLSAEEKSKLLTSFFPGALNEAKKVLSWLDDKKIVILRGKDGLGHFSYLDKRSAEEKQATSYKVADPPRKVKVSKWWEFWN